MLVKIVKKINPNSKFIKIWENKRIKSLILLFFWIIFIALLFVIFVLPYEDNKKIDSDTTIKTNSFTTTKNELLKQNYEYEYKITINDTSIVYEGVRRNEESAGYKKINYENPLKYYINEEELFLINGEERVLTDTLFENINENYLDINYIFDLMDNVKYTDKNNEISFNYENIYVTISYVESSLAQIKITNDSEVYELLFTNINNVPEDKDILLLI